MTDRQLRPLFTWRSAIADSELPPPARHVALALSLYMNERGASAFPGGELLAKDTGYSLRTVRAMLKLLETTGYVHVVFRGGSPAGGKRQASVYQASVPGTTSEGAAPVEISTTGAGDAPVNTSTSEPYSSVQTGAGDAPVHLTTVTGAGAAPQLSKNSSRETPDPTTVVVGDERSKPGRRGLRANGTNPRAIAAAADESAQRFRDLGGARIVGRRAAITLGMTDEADARSYLEHLVGHDAELMDVALAEWRSGAVQAASA